MSVPLKSLTADTWKDVKKDAGIKKTKWYVAGSVSVGSKVEALNKARAAYKASKNMKTIMKYFSTLDDFVKALDKFVKEKDFKKDVDGKLAAMIGSWRKEAGDKQVALAQKVKQNGALLKSNDVRALEKQFDTFIL